MNNKNEELLKAWLQLSTAISNDRVVSVMPYNEALICNLLYQNQLEYPEQELTATDLCRSCKMLKSQMNRTLQSMEDKGIILRKRSDSDKRQVFITLNQDSDLYKQQHQEILTLIDRLMQQIGTEKTDEIIKLFTLITKTAAEVIE